MVSDTIRETLKQSHIHVYGTIISAVVIIAGAAYLIKSFYETRNTFTQYRLNQYLMKDWKTKYPDLEIKQY